MPLKLPSDLAPFPATEPATWVPCPCSSSGPEPDQSTIVARLSKSRWISPSVPWLSTPVSRPESVMPTTWPLPSKPRLSQVQSTSIIPAAILFLNSITDLGSIHFIPSISISCWRSTGRETTYLVAVVLTYEYILNS